MSYHVVVPRFGFKELPDRVLVREDGAYGDHKAHGTPLINYWYVLEQRIPPTEREIISAHLEQLEADNAKLRELAAGIGHLLFALDVDYCAGCPRDDINHPCPVYTVKGGECLYETDLRELGVEVDA